LKEPKYRTYQPLLDEEKEALKDTEITKYEEKAKSGMLRGDSILSLLETRMRTSVSTPVETGSTKYKTLSSIGIDTGASYTDNGKLRIKSESKLRAALAEEPDAVMAIFNQAGNGDSNTNDVGIVNRMYDQFQTSMDLIKKKAGVFGSLENSSSIGSQLITLGKEILRKNDYLNGLENKLYLQFSRMERAMSDFNAQSSYLSNNISAMNK
jgi:flagellar hook-associated protein 2